MYNMQHLLIEVLIEAAGLGSQLVLGARKSLNCAYLHLMLVLKFHSESLKNFMDVNVLIGTPVISCCINSLYTVYWPFIYNNNASTELQNAARSTVLGPGWENRNMHIYKYFSCNLKMP